MSTATITCNFTVEFNARSDHKIDDHTAFCYLLVKMFETNYGEHGNESFAETIGALKHVALYESRKKLAFMLVHVGECMDKFGDDFTQEDRQAFIKDRDDTLHILRNFDEITRSHGIVL